MYLGRKDITNMLQKGLLTHGTMQILLFASLMPCDFENKMSVIHHQVRISRMPNIYWGIKFQSIKEVSPTAIMSH